MGVSSYVEFITTLFGWILYDNFWSVLSESGVVYIPFAVIFVKHIAESRKAGDDEGSAGIQSLKKIETDIFLAIFVLFLAAVPFQTVQLSQMQYARPTVDCRVVDDINSGATQAVVQGSNTGTSYDNVLATISGQSGRIPLWWGGLHVMTKAIVAGSIAGVPCSGALSSVDARLAGASFDDDRVAKELNTFVRDCYMPSRAQFMRENKTVTAAERESMGWVGSEYFMRTTYRKYYSFDPRADFPFDAARDAGFEADQNRGGHPMCDQWWPTLRTKVLNSVDLSLTDEFIYRARNLIQMASRDTLSKADREDVFLRKYLAVKKAPPDGFGNLSYSAAADESFTSPGLLGFLSDTGNFIDNVAADTALGIVSAAGAAVKLPGHLAGGLAAREGAPIFISLVLMVFIAMLPFLMVFSLYSLAKTATFSVIFFALHSFYILWAIAFWMDNNLTAALTSGQFGVFSSSTSPTQMLIIVWIQRILYVVFPGLWLVMIGWIGIRMDGLNNSSSGMNSSAAAPGETGGNIAVSAATKA